MATVYKLTKLAAVNIVLSNIGQAPLTSLTTSNPMAAVAEGIIDEVSFDNELPKIHHQAVIVFYSSIYINNNCIIN